MISGLDETLTTHDLTKYLVKGHELGQPILIHIPDKEIPDTPIEEFEREIEEFCKEE